uniref:Uncharacterized protein n=1 Tax=Aureoumbra lagunensis TaxID=44058 RepID=A0A7S3NP45_9STRA
MRTENENALFLSFRLWQRFVELDVLRDMYEEVRVLYASAVEALGQEVIEDSSLRIELNEALRDRDEAIRQRNFYRVHAETLERELESRRLTSTPLRELTDHRRISQAKWINHLKTRRNQLRPPRSSTNIEHRQQNLMQNQRDLVPEGESSDSRRNQQEKFFPTSSKRILASSSAPLFND